MATDSGSIAITIVVTVALAIPAVALGLHLSRKLFPRPQRTPQVEATVKRFKRMILLYFVFLLALACVVWWLTGNLLAGIGIILAVMVVLQLVVGGIVTHERHSSARTSRETTIAPIRQR